MDANQIFDALIEAALEQLEAEGFVGDEEQMIEAAKALIENN